jgi:flagellar biosynthesis GTPase FlhF
MDNIHLLIVVGLLAFGTGHAIFRTGVSFWGFILITILFVPVISQIAAEDWYTVVITSFIVGLAFAHRDIVTDILQDVGDVLRKIGEFFQNLTPTKRNKNQPNNPHQNHHNQNDQQYHQYQQDERAREQARREAEVNAKREQARKKKQQQKQQEQKEQSHSQQKNRQQQNRQQQNRQQQNRQQQNRQQQNRQQQNRKQESNNNRYSNDQQQNNQQHQRKEPVKETPTDNRSPMDILGLKPGFTQQELKQAYRRESARCHPDKWASKPKPIRDAMAEEQKQVNWAYKQLQK